MQNLALDGLETQGSQRKILVKNSCGGGQIELLDPKVVQKVSFWHIKEKTLRFRSDPSPVMCCGKKKVSKGWGLRREF